VKLAFALLASCGCLGPQVSDELAASGDIVPAGTAIPTIDSDSEDATTLAANDHVDGVVPLLSAFAGGTPAHAWDFGPAPTFATPMFVVVTRASDGTLTPTGHPPIVGAIAGEPTYSPFCSMYALVVTAAYRGELITSTTAIEEAVRDGLIETPVAQPLAYDRPQVASDVTLDVGVGPPIVPSAVFYYEHKTVPYFDFGAMPIDQQVNVPIATRYVLARDGQAPLSEPLRGVDMDHDGDTNDSNDVFDGGASPLRRTVDVAVVTSVASIDTSGNEALADVEDAAQLFDPNATAVVIAVDATDDLRNYPQQRTAGGL
jgi:hypothetical protein